MPDCPFCIVARWQDPSAAIAYRDERLMVFADRSPIRPGHMQIVPRLHVETFDALAPDLLAEMAWLGQRVARAQKAIYGVTRVGFAFTGNDVPHVHAHVVPLHERTDITSARYFEGELPPRAGRRATAAEMAEAARVIARFLD